MVKRVGGLRRKTRHKYSKHYRRKGKVTISDFMSVYKEGDKVVLKIEPSLHSGTYCRRFYGRSGIIAGKQGSCYKVSIYDQGKKKTVLTHPAYLRRA